MSKFWIEVKHTSKACAPSTKCVATYGTIEDALNYAWDYMIYDFGRNEVTIYNANMEFVRRENW